MICPRMVHSGKKYIPILMFLQWDTTAAGKVLVEQFSFRHALHRELAPVRQCAAAALSCNLIGEEVHSAFLNTVILQLNDANLVVVEKPQHFPLIYRCQ